MTVQLDLPTQLSVYLKLFINLRLIGRSRAKPIRSDFFQWQTVICHKCRSVVGRMRKHGPVPRTRLWWTEEICPTGHKVAPARPWLPCPKSSSMWHNFFLTLDLFQLRMEPNYSVNQEFLYSVVWIFLFLWLLRFSFSVLSESLSHFKQLLFKIPVSWLLVWYFRYEISEYIYQLHFIK